MHTGFTLTRFTSVLCLGLVLAGCSGGGSDSSIAPAADEGSVTLLVGDGPINEFDQAVLEVSQILLLAEDDSSVTLLAEPATVDLLELQNISELLVDSATVPAGTYEKIRLEIDSITLNRTDVDGLVIPGESESVDVPASGRIDLNPRGQFVIGEGESLELEVDVDLDGAVRRNQDGSLRFRPVVFIDRIGDSFRGRNSRMHGVMRNLDAGSGTLELCNARRLSNDDDNEQLNRCINVNSSDQTLFVNSAAETIGFDSLIDGDEATVFGRYRDRAINAAVVAVGERNTFRNLEGEVSSAPTAEGDFELVVDDLRGVEEGQTISVSLAEGSRLFSDEDDLQTPETSDLQPGVEVEARGVLVEDAEGNLSFVAFFLHIENEDDDEDDDAQGASEEEGDDEEIEVTGTVESIDLENNRVVIVDDLQNTICLQLDEDSDVVLVTDDAESAETTEVSIADFAVGDLLEVAGELDEGSDCVEAEDIVIVVTGVEG